MMTRELHNLYESDETAWLDAMAQLIRDGHREDLDYRHLGEFFEDRAKRDRREVKSRLRVLIAHVLKWLYQKEMRTPSWRETVNAQRRLLEEELLTRGTLRNHAESILEETYAKAIKDAAQDSNLPTETFPTECPWTLDQLLQPEILDS